MKAKLLKSLALPCAAFIALAGRAAAAEKAPSGTPDATTTISGKQLPPAESKFGGVINETAKDSKPWWPPRVVPPKVRRMCSSS
jgi:arylsulfatase